MNFTDFVSAGVGMLADFDRDVAMEGVRKFVCEALIEREFHR